MLSISCFDQTIFNNLQTKRAHQARFKLTTKLWSWSRSTRRVRYRTLTHIACFKHRSTQAFTRCSWIRQIVTGEMQKLLKCDVGLYEHCLRWCIFHYLVAHSMVEFYELIEWCKHFKIFEPCKHWALFNNCEIFHIKMVAVASRWGMALQCKCIFLIVDSIEVHQNGKILDPSVEMSNLCKLL